MKPTAAPARFPYHEHRTVAEVDRAEERLEGRRMRYEREIWRAKRRRRLEAAQ